jgi:hypothetical protein
MHKIHILAATALLLIVTAPASAQSRTQVGMLTCRTGPSVGLIVGSRQRLDCRFAPSAGGGVPERYGGIIRRVGLDVGITAGGVMGWAVLAPTTALPRGALAGNYGGASGDVSLGLGVGANVLVGGSRRTVSLQPVSVEGQVGVNLALGVAGLELRAIR